MFGAFIIGDELLVGKREDKHLGFLIRALAKRGLRLGWVRASAPLIGRLVKIKAATDLGTALPMQVAGRLLVGLARCPGSNPGHVRQDDRAGLEGEAGR